LSNRSRVRPSKLQKLKLRRRLRTERYEIRSAKIWRRLPREWRTKI
jgi:hypothetical protein